MLVGYIAHSIYEARESPSRAFFNIFGPILHAHILSKKRTPRWIMALIISGALEVAACFVIVHLR